MKRYLLFALYFLPVLVMAQAVDITRLPSLRSWTLETSGASRGNGGEAVVLNFTRAKAKLQVSMRTYENPKSATDMFERAKTTAAVQFEVKNEIIRNLNFRFVEFKEWPVDRISPTSLLVTGVRGNNFYELRIRRAYEPGEKVSETHKLKSDLAQITREVVDHIESQRKSKE